MKKIAVFLLTVALVLGGVGCADKGGKEGETKVNYKIWESKTQMKTDGQLYTGGEIRFPASLWQTPQAERYDALDRDALGVQGYFIDSVQDTKVFAFVGIPESASAENPVPGVVLVHGGGGTAFFEWVSYWVKRGYAAVAMDTDGNMPVETSRMNNNDHAASIRTHGPANAGFSDWQKPVEEQWAYHAIASVIVCNSFLRGFEGVDGTRIGLTGISYGSFLTCQAAAYDDRFCFAAPVYGSLDQSVGDTLWAGIMKDRKKELWDDNVILQGNKTPFFYLNSNIDQFFSVLATTESDKKTANSQMLLKYGFLHGHDLGGLQVPDLFAFADNICLGTPGLPLITEQPTAQKQTAAVKLPHGVTVDEVTGYYTRSTVLKEDSVWLPVAGDFANGIAEVSIPGNATYFYMNIADSRDLEASSHVVKL